MSAQKIKAGEAFVEVTCADGKLKQGFNNVEKQCQQFQKKTEKFGTGISLALTAAFTGIAYAVKRALSNVAQFGDTLDKMSQRIGVSVESLSRLNVIAQLSGSSLDQMEGAITKMNKALGSSSGEFDKLGLSISELSSKNTDEAFLDILSALSKVSNTAERTSLAMGIFGKSATQLFPLINKGAKGIEEMSKELDTLGITMSTEEAQALADFNDAWTKVKATIGSLVQHTLVALTPVLTKVADVLKSVIGYISNFTKEHKTLTSVIVTACDVFATATAGMLAWNLAAGKLASGIKLVNLALKALSTNPWVLGITAAVGGIMLLINAFKKSKPEADEFIKKAEEITAKHDSQRKADNALMEELEGLSNKTNKSAAEMQRAEQICNTLNSQYGDLGLTVNKTTGAIEGLTEAQKKMNDIQKQTKIADVKAEITALEKAKDIVGGEQGYQQLRGELSNIQTNAALENNGNGDSSHEYLYANRKAYRERYDKIKAYEDSVQQIQARKEYLAALESGGAIDEGESVLDSSAAKSYNSAFDRTNSLAEEAAKIGKKSWELKIEEAEKAYAKAIQDAEEVKKGDLAYGMTEEFSNNRYNENVANAQKIRDEAIAKAREEEQAEIDRANDEKLKAQQEQIEKEKALRESEQSQREQDYQKGLDELETIRKNYSNAMKNGDFERAEGLGKDYSAKKEELELAKSNADLEASNQELIVALEELAEAEKSGDSDRIVEARQKAQEAQSNVNSARESQTSATQAIYERQKEQQREREEAEKQLAEAQKEQMRKQEEYLKIVGQDMNENLKTSYSSKGSFNAWDMMGGGNSVAEQQLKLAERNDKWQQKIIRELQEFNNKNLEPTYA